MGVCLVVGANVQIGRESLTVFQTGSQVTYRGVAAQKGGWIMFSHTEIMRFAQ